MSIENPAFRYDDYRTVIFEKQWDVNAVYFPRRTKFCRGNTGRRMCSLKFAVMRP